MNNNITIKINEYESISLDAINDSFLPIKTIEVTNEKDITHTMTMAISEDYCFLSRYNVTFKEMRKMKKQTHTIENTHLLYIPLLHLLNGDEELIIDDDFTDEINERYLRIYKDNDNINIDFINEIENDRSFERFCVNIKNVEPDIRSKIDCLGKDTKKRLKCFFDEAINLIETKNNQISAEEKVYRKKKQED